MSNTLAIIRIRGVHDISKDLIKAFECLHLLRKHSCSLVEDTPSIRGQIQKVKDHVTWGLIDDETQKLLVEKRGKEFKGRLEDSQGKIKYKVLEIGGKKLKPHFNLHPPKGGFERKGIKVAFKTGGALGDRKEKINDLIKKMI
ncbi:uL30 family ribosomal protein [Nanoarchaeota archaeon]